MGLGKEREGGRGGRGGEHLMWDAEGGKRLAAPLDLGVIFSDKSDWDQKLGGNSLTSDLWGES